jgi:hypothetical protein
MQQKIFCQFAQAAGGFWRLEGGGSWIQIMAA